VDGVDGDETRRFLRFDTGRVRSLQADMTKRTAEATAAAGYWLVDEQRAHTGQAPLPKNAGQVLAGAATAEANDAAEDVRSGRADRAAKSADTEAKAAADAAARRAALEARATREEPAYQRTARALFAAERAGVLKTLAAAVPEGKSAEDDLAAAVAGPYLEAAALKIAADYGTDEAYHAAWKAAYEALIRETFTDASEALAAQVGFAVDLAAPHLVAAAERRALELAGFVTETTKEAIKQAIADGIAAGDGLKAVTARVRAVFAEASEARARTIARTETIGAVNEGEHQAARASGVLRSKAWLSSGVGEARPRLAREEAAGYQPIDAPYPVTGKQHPHDSIGGARENANCRCGQLFSDLDPADAGAEDA
jgi:hypothetical protein